MSEPEENKSGKLIKAPASSIQKVQNGLIKRGMEDVERALATKEAFYGQELRKLPHSDRVLSVVFSPDGSFLASAGDDQRIKIWLVGDGSLLNNFDTGMEWVRNVLISPNGLYLAGVGCDWEAKCPNSDLFIWRLIDRSIICRIKLNKITSITFSPDSSMIAFDEPNKKNISLLSVTDGNIIRTFTEKFSCWEIKFNPDGTMIACSAGKCLKLWNVSDGTSFRRIMGHSSYICSIEFNPDGSVLAARCGDKSIRLWSVLDGSLIRVLSEPSDEDNDCNIAFNTDGSILASGVDDNICLWNISDGNIIHTLTGHEGHVFSVAFSSDGSLLASGSADKTTRIWNLIAHD